MRGLGFACAGFAVLTCSVAAAQPAPAPITPQVPSVTAPDASSAPPPTPFDTLEISARSFFTFLSYPNPQLRGVVAVTDDTRLVWIKRSGLHTIGSGEPMRRLLLDMFKPDEKTVIQLADPVVSADGPFGRVSRKFSIKEAGRKPECVTFYGEAVHQQKTGWRFTQITFVMGERFAPCRIDQP